MNLNIKWKIIKLLDQKTGENHVYLVLGKEFLYLTSKAQLIKGIIDKVDLIKMKNSCSAKDSV